MVIGEGRGMVVAPEALVRAVAARSSEVIERLRALTTEALGAPSALPGWSRLTIACHLRYGADAFRRMTEGALAGEAVAYYPEGRERQRPDTLHPAPDESPVQAVESLRVESDRLASLWSGLHDEHWSLVVTEPDDNRDLGPQRLSSLPLLRLTEVEVHGTDLDLGLSPWSDVFVRAALSFRLDWLNRRRTNHRGHDRSVAGSWLLVATDGPTYLVVTDGSLVESRPGSHDDRPTATITGTSRDLLALLLGRRPDQPLRHGGDVRFAERFPRAFPGP
jgi:uncharacterized protein (TIGR03083 family)